MSEEYLNPNNSPDGLDGHPAAGVRRLNKLPLIAVGVLTVVVITTLVFAAQQRANKRHQETATEETTNVQPRDTRAGFNALVQGYTDGTIPPLDTPKPAPAPSDNNGNKTPPGHPARMAGPPPRSHGLSKEEKRRLQRARQFREDLFYDAVVADTAIKLPNRESDRNRNGNLPPGALGTDGMATERERRIQQAMKVSARATGMGSGRTSPTLLGGLDGGESDPNLRARKDEFQRTERRYGYSSEFRRPPLTPYELRVGTVIPAVMISGINSDLPGEIIAQVSQNVRDTRSGQHILIPQGSKLIGSYDSHVAMGQERVMLAWHRLQFPDGSTMEVGNMGGTDQAGYAGFKDKVNNHYWRIFGNATLLSLISAGAQLSQPDDNSDETTAREELAAELGRQWGQVGQQMTRRNMNIQPTLEIRPGYRFNVMVNKDLILEPYETWPTGES